MYQPQAYGIALSLMVGSMLCWGSWASTLKMTPGWSFQLFYWDYVLGVILASLLWGLTLGSFGNSGLPFVADLVQADSGHLGLASAGGAVFNVANLLLVAAIEIAGLAIAFPIGIGLALVVGVLLSYVLEPKGNAVLLATGVVVVMLAIGFDAYAYRLREATRLALSNRGIWISIACGILMGLFYPLVDQATRGKGSLGPYSVALVFSFGVAGSALIANSYLMRRPLTKTAPVNLSGYFSAPARWHLWGLLGGAIWCTGTVWNLVASHAHIVGPAVSYAIGQGATLVSALWGVFVWREFQQAPAAARRMLWPMFVLFVVGLGLIAIAPLWPAGELSP
jgi:glucose uptake protein